MAKRGRKHDPYRTSWGENIDGLRRRNDDGRWVIVATSKTYVERDERRAVARFKQWKAEQVGQATVELIVPLEAFQSQEGIDAAFQAGAGFGWSPESGFSMSLEASLPMLWAWFREQLIERPEYVAQQVGIPEVARLGDLPKPQTSPTLKAIGQLYQDKSEAQQKQRRQTQLFWDHFEKWMATQNVVTLRQLTPALMAEYADDAKATAKKKQQGKGGSAKYLKNRFTTIRGVINFARKRGEHPGDIRHALDCCAVLQAPKRVGSKNPHPLNREDLQNLLDAVTEPRMHALLLAMLNLCMYPSEVLALDWGEVDLKKRTVVTARSKTAVIRIGVLWPRTVKALRKIKPRRAKHDSPIFLSREGSRWSVKTVNNQYRQLRDKASVKPSVKCEDFRDGAYTAAIESGADLTQAKLLAGHATGISDYYAKRKPTMVTEAVAAIEKAYFGVE